MLFQLTSTCIKCETYSSLAYATFSTIYQSAISSIILISWITLWRKRNFKKSDCESISPPFEDNRGPGGLNFENSRGWKDKIGKIPGGGNNLDGLPSEKNKSEKNKNNKKNNEKFQGDGESFHGIPGGYSIWNWISSTGYGLLIKKPIGRLVHLKLKKAPFLVLVLNFYLKLN